MLSALLIKTNSIAVHLKTESQNFSYRLWALNHLVRLLEQVPSTTPNLR